MAKVTRRLVAIPALGFAATLAFTPAALAQDRDSTANSSSSNTSTSTTDQDATSSATVGDVQQGGIAFDGDVNNTVTSTSSATNNSNTNTEQDSSSEASSSNGP